jgi:hypothetical protein
MRPPSTALALSFVASFAAVTHGQDPAPAAAAPPRLAVLCSVDQLATWFLAEGLPFCADDGGFRRLARDGVEFERCAYLHGCTETGPGHATIGTGATAAVHGIVKNAWWVPAEGRAVYCVQDTAAPLPGLPEGKDRGPGRLLVPTLGCALKAQVPGAKVASVSWKDRSAILMAGRSADVAAWIEVATGRLVTNTTWVKEAPAWLAQWNEANAIDGYHGWRWERTGPDAAYAGLADDRVFELPHQNGSNQRTLPQSITGAKPEPGPSFYAELFASPAGNEIVRLAAQACVEGMALGADAVPDLLCVSFSSTDQIGHLFGPDSVEARDALLRLDCELARFFAFLDERVGAGRWAVFLTSDHGVGPTPEAAKAAGRDAGRGALQSLARAAAERDLAAAFGAPPPGTRYVAHTGEFSLYLDRRALAARRGERGDDAMLLEAARIAARAVIGTRGIVAAYPTTELLRGASADPIERAVFHATHPDRAGDMQLVVRPLWLDGVVPASHGTPHAYDREVPAFAMGPGLRRGARCVAEVSPGLGAVVLSRLLGIAPPAAATEAVPDGVLAAR